MIKVNGNTIEECLLKASKELRCEVIDLDYEIIQMPRVGVLGIGKREARIVAGLKEQTREIRSGEFSAIRSDSRDSHKIDSRDLRDSCDSRMESQNDSRNLQDSRDSWQESRQDSRHDSHKDSRDSRVESQQDSRDSWQDSHDWHDTYNAQESYREAKKHSIDIYINEISDEINKMFALLPFKLARIEVSQFDYNTVLIHFKGEDAALLIGEKGYRYKAISYLLFNWINSQYGLNIRLEIESFLASQESMMANYLIPIIESVRRAREPFTSKPFDGVLAYIALRQLRAEFPDRSVTIKNDENDEHRIVILPPL